MFATEFAIVFTVKGAPLGIVSVLHRKYQTRLNRVVFDNTAAYYVVVVMTKKSDNICSLGVYSQTLFSS